MECKVTPNRRGDKNRERCIDNTYEGFICPLLQYTERSTDVSHALLFRFIYNFHVLYICTPLFIIFKHCNNY